MKRSLRLCKAFRKFRFTFFSFSFIDPMAMAANFQLCNQILDRFVLAPGVTACPRTGNPSEYDKCVLQQLQAITPYLAKGVPSLKLPALDPLFLPSLTVDRNLESLRIKANMSQIRVYGGTNYVVRELKANPNDLTVFIKALLPHLYVNGDYDVQGRLLLLPLSGLGNFKGNFSKCKCDSAFEPNPGSKSELDDLVRIRPDKCNRIIYRTERTKAAMRKVKESIIHHRPPIESYRSLIGYPQLRKK